jgi:hypothetical protein
VHNPSSKRLLSCFSSHHNIRFLFDLLGRLVNASEFLGIRLSSLSFPESAIPRISPQRPIPPSKRRGKIIDKGLVMEIMVVGASPEGDEFV